MKTGAHHPIRWRRRCSAAVRRAALGCWTLHRSTFGYSTLRRTLGRSTARHATLGWPTLHRSSFGYSTLRPTLGRSTARRATLGCPTLRRRIVRRLTLGCRTVRRSALRRLALRRSGVRHSAARRWAFRPLTGRRRNVRSLTGCARAVGGRSGLRSWRGAPLSPSTVPHWLPLVGNRGDWFDHMATFHPSQETNPPKSAGGRSGPAAVNRYGQEADLVLYWYDWLHLSEREVRWPHRSRPNTAAMRSPSTS